MNTNKLSAKDIKREKHLIDGSDQILGRLASGVAKILMGKNKSYYVPYLDIGDYVTITNAAKVKLTGRKAVQKKYISHSGYPGGLKVETFEKMIIRKPQYIVEHAIKGMLPKGKLGKAMFKKLTVYAGEVK